MTKNPTPAGPKPSPAKMLSELSNTTTLMWIGVAFLIHVVVFGATSVSYLRTAFTAGAAESRPDEAEAATAKPTPAPAPTAPPVAAKPSAPEAKPAEVVDESKMLEAHKDSPVVKSITDAAKPSELPKAPSRNGLDLDSLEGK